MRKNLIALILGLFITIPLIGQVKTDTLYYDKDWKGVESKTFATYFRIYTNSSDDNFSKQFRDYYVTGELQSEGEYISIDKYDDSKSIFDGGWITYYKSSQVNEKGCHVKGKLEGEYTECGEDGLILRHAYFKDGKLHGIYTKFSEDEGLCFQIEYENGEPLHDYCLISNKDGFCSKVSLDTQQPIYETPSLNERNTEYKNGEAWPYYNKNGIMIGMTNKEVRDYGKYFQIPIVIANNSLFSIDFEPAMIAASLIDTNGHQRYLKVYSAAEYMKRVRRKQNWAIALRGLAEGLVASGAGYLNSTTSSSYSGHSSSYGSSSAYGSYSENSSYNESSTSTTSSYNAAAAYQALVIASDRVATYDNALLSERATKNKGYLKRTTIYPGETISGYIHIERAKEGSLYIYIRIHGVIYTFPWDINE